MKTIGCSPIFGSIAATCTVLVFALPFAIVLFEFREGGPVDQPGWGPLAAVLVSLVLVFIAAGSMAITSVISGTLALLRGERHSWLAWLGLIVGGTVLVMIGIATVSGHA